jgi:V/A-type H+-transporting ATPase subunit K
VEEKIMVAFVAAFVGLAAVFMIMAVKEGRRSNTVKMKNLIKLSSAMIGLSAFSVFASIFAMAAPEAGEVIANGFTDRSFAFLGAAISTAASSIGAGYAVAHSASAAIGAVSENDKMTGKALIFVALGEGIALYGIIISILILNA